jgi:uncharacterized membrane protein YraQ (UPF0718 family)
MVEEVVHGVVVWLVVVGEIFEIIVVVVLVVIIRSVDAYSTDEKVADHLMGEAERLAALVLAVAVLVGDLPWRVE